MLLRRRESPTALRTGVPKHNSNHDIEARVPSLTDVHWLWLLSVAMLASLPPTAHAPAPARGRLLRQPVDPCKSIWQAAVLKYKMEVGASLVSLDVPCLDSSAAIFDYLARCEDSFKSFRGDGLQQMRDRLCPIAGVVEMLCGALGEGFALVRTPMMCKPLQRLTSASRLSHLGRQSFPPSEY